MWGLSTCSKLELHFMFPPALLSCSIRGPVLCWTGHQFHKIRGPLHLSTGDTGAAACLFTTLGWVLIHQVGWFHFVLFILTSSQVTPHTVTGRFSISRPAVASYVSLAFGRYVVEPFFAPCAAPTVLIRLVSILGVSEWFYTSSLYPKYHYTSLYVINMNFSFTVCVWVSAAFVVAVNCWSVTLASRTQVTLTFIKMFALVLIIIPGIIALAKGGRVWLLGFEKWDESVAQLLFAPFQEKQRISRMVSRSTH